MKKLVISLVLGASLAIVPSAFALKAMTADNMKDTTGQAGVSIALDDVTLYQYVGATTYTDNDGVAGVSTDAAGLVISGKETITTLRGIIDHTSRGGFLHSVQGHTDGYASILQRNLADDGTDEDIEIAALSIDVSAQVETLSIGKAFNYRDLAMDTANYIAGGGDTTVLSATALGLAAAYTAAAGGATDDAALSAAIAVGAIKVAGVVIGLPTLEIVKTGDTQTYSISAAGSANDGKEYIQITKSDSVLAILGGTLEICPH